MKNFSCYCIRLRRAANCITELYDSYLSPLGISVTQYSLLSNLAELKDSSVSELAAYIGLERTTVVRTLRPLLERGWVEDRSAKEERNRRLSLTDEGKKIQRQANEAWQKAQAEIENRVDEEEITALEKILSKLSD